MDRIRGGVWTVISNKVEPLGGEVVLQRSRGTEKQTLCGDEAIALRKGYWLIQGMTITVD